MNISAANANTDTGNSSYGAQTISTSVADSRTVGANSTNTGDVAANTAVDGNVTTKAVTVPELKKMTAAMNQFVETMDTNIRFKFHEKTKELMVQVIDQSNNKVLKEIPSQEFLDTIAAIRSVVGMMLDKKM